MPSPEAAKAAPRILVLPLADRAAPAKIGRIHNAVDDLLRRDLMCFPAVSVYPTEAFAIPVQWLYSPEFRSIETATKAGTTVGATHVLIGEVAAREDQVAIEVDLVNVADRSVVDMVRVQDREDRIQKRIPALRRGILDMFELDVEEATCPVPGYTPPLDVLQHVGYGQMQAASGDYSQALIEFYEGIEDKRPFADAFWRIAETQLELGARTRAEQGYVAALSYDPDHVEIYWRYGLMRIRSGPGGADTDALRLCQEAARRAPLFGPAHLTLGTLWFHEKQYDHADRHFELAHILLPHSVWPLYNHANILRVQGDIAGARAVLEEAIRIGPGSAEVRAQYGLLLSEQGEHEAALEALQHAANLDRKNSLYLYYVGAEYDRLGRRHEALTAYRAAAAYPFSNAWLDVKLGEAFLDHGELKAAERVLAAGYGDGHQDAELVLLYSRVLLALAQEDPLRRRDYTTRTRNMLEALLRTDISGADRKQAELMLVQAEALGR